MIHDAIQPAVNTKYGKGILEDILVQPNGWVYARVRMENGTWINFGVMRLEEFLANTDSIKKA
jgi:hypothetical protein